MTVRKIVTLSLIEIEDALLEKYGPLKGLGKNFVMKALNSYFGDPDLVQIELSWEEVDFAEKPF